MNIFLKLKNWQLFGLFICAYLAFQITGTSSVIVTQDETKTVSERNYFGYKTTTVNSTQKTDIGDSTVISSSEFTVTITKYSPVMIVLIVVLLGWFYAVGVFLKKKLPNTVKMDTSKFKFFFFTPLCYMLLFYCISLYLFHSVSNGNYQNLGIIIILIPLHFFSMLCLLYCVYYLAKVLKAVEFQRPVTFSEYIVEFLLILFFPIGIWFIQPKINKIFNDNGE